MTDLSGRSARGRSGSAPPGIEAEVTGLTVMSDSQSAKHPFATVIAILVGISPLAAIMVWAALPIKPGDIKGHQLYLEAERLRVEAERLRGDGQIEEVDNQIRRVIELCEQALEWNPQSSDAYCTKALALAFSGKVAQAMTQFFEAHRIKPSHPVANFNIGSFYHRQGRLEKAQQYYEMTLLVSKGHAEAHNNLAMLLSGDKALDHYQSAVRLKPDYFEGHRNLANTLRSMGRIDAAVTHYQKAMQIAPESVEPCFMLALIRAEHSNAKYRDPDEAIEYATRAAQLTNYREPTVLKVLAAAQALAGRLGEAIATTEQALAIASKAQHAQLASQIDKRLQLYRKQQAHQDGETLP